MSLSREYERDSLTKRLRILLPLLLDHNREHVKDIEKWAKKAGETGHHELAVEMKEIIRLYKEAGIHFEIAVKKIEP